jgi:hypothetical protein
VISASVERLGIPRRPRYIEFFVLPRVPATLGDLAEVDDDVGLNGAAIIDEGERDDGDLDEITSGDEDAEEEGWFLEAGLIQSSLAAHEALFNIGQKGSAP